MADSLSQHQFKAYGADKEEIETALKELKKQKKIHSFKYDGLVSLTQMSPNEVDFSKTINDLLAVGIVLEQTKQKLNEEYTKTNVIGFEAGEDRRFRG